MMETPSTREDLARCARQWRENAITIVRDYARLHTRAVASDKVESICRALGDISIDEAIDVLDRLQREAL